MTKKNLFVYLPVVHKGILEIIKKEDFDTVFVIDDALSLMIMPKIRKEIRALKSKEIVSVLNVLSKTETILVSSEKEVYEKAKNCNNFLINDEFSRELDEKINVNFYFLNGFLRWDGLNGSLREDIYLEENPQSFIELASKIASFSSDFWRRVGAVATKENEILISAYNEHLPTEYSPYINGDPRGSFTKGQNIEISTAIHAEANLIANAARKGVALEGSDIWVTTFPCPNCAKLIAKTGFKRCYFLEGYSMLEGEELLREHGIEIIKIE